MVWEMIRLQHRLQENTSCFLETRRHKLKNLRYNLQHVLGAHNVAEYGGRYSWPQFWLVKMKDYQFGRVMTSSPGLSTLSFCPILMTSREHVSIRWRKA